ncbi:MAG: gfo/Idh/MocA family oxidoreductase [Propionibacteriales bacterium]|nr:gfo/Idh/MocA family oxidoreductase [Propionibacteriales bacterium]
MEKIDVGIIGTGWCGGIRAQTAASSPLVAGVHLAEIDRIRLKELAEQTGAVTATTDYHDLVADDRIDALMISATPETTHYPMAKAALEAGKHVLLEKPLALTLEEGDELIELAERQGVKFTVGYSQRFNTKQAMVKRSIEDGTLGEPVSALISRHITRRLGDKIGGRIVLSPAAMEATHDIDFLLWCLQPARPVRVYAQAVERVMKEKYGTSDCMSIVVTMDSGVVLTVAAGWILPPGYPNFSTTWMEIVGTEGALLLDDSHRDIVLNTMSEGMTLPLSTMPGEQVRHVYAGPMEQETLYFLDAVVFDRDVLVRPREARQAMEVYLAADLSAERNAPVDLPLSRDEEEPALVAGTV